MGRPPRREARPPDQLRAAARRPPPPAIRSRMIFVIDTSSALSAVALLEPSGRTVYEDVADSGPTFDLPSRYRALEDGPAVTRVAVAAGPGSFTGLRVGVSFGLGLAIGLRIPIIPLPSLDLRAARSELPVTAVLDAGRGRVYYQLPGAEPRLGEPAEIPTSHPMVGDVAPKTEAALVASGHRLVPERQLQDRAAAAEKMLETAREVPYGSLEIEYMQSFSASRK